MILSPGQLCLQQSRVVHLTEEQTYTYCILFEQSDSSVKVITFSVREHAIFFAHAQFSFWWEVEKGVEPAQKPWIQRSEISIDDM